MLTKILNLGYEVPETGEPRMRLLVPGLVKTAATEIQEFRDSIDTTDDKSSWLWVIGVSAMEYYGGSVRNISHFPHTVAGIGRFAIGLYAPFPSLAISAVENAFSFAVGARRCIPPEPPVARS